MGKRTVSLAIASALAVIGGVTVWRYVILQPVEVGSLTTCTDCRAVIANDVTAIRVPFWRRDAYARESRQALCRVCGARPTAATREQTTYCQRCKRPIKSETVSGTVPRSAYDKWMESHQWKWATCPFCEYKDLVQNGLQLQAEGKYPEAERAYLAAIAVYSDSSDARRFLRSLRDAHADEIAQRKKEVSRQSATAQTWPMPAPTRELPGQGRWVGRFYVERFSGEPNADFEQRCRDVANLQALSDALKQNER